MKRLLLIFITLILVVGAVAFYGGIKYQQNKTQGSLQNIRNMTPEQRQQMLPSMGAGAAGVWRGGRTGDANSSGFATGEILSKDDKSATIKLRDGGSRIIFFSDATEITKSASGTPADLETGKTITVSGETNQDGSLTAKSIQLRPAPAN